MTVIWWLITIIWSIVYKQSIMCSNEMTVRRWRWRLDRTMFLCWHKWSYWLSDTVQLQAVCVETHPASSHRSLLSPQHVNESSSWPTIQQLWMCWSLLMRSDEVGWGLGHTSGRWFNNFTVLLPPHSVLIDSLILTDMWSIHSVYCGFILTSDLLFLKSHLSSCFSSRLL